MPCSLDLSPLVASLGAVPPNTNDAAFACDPDVKVGFESVFGVLLPAADAAPNEKAGRDPVATAPSPVDCAPNEMDLDSDTGALLPSGCAPNENWASVFVEGPVDGAPNENLDSVTGAMLPSGGAPNEN